MDWRLLLFPVIGAGIGYFTNYLAVRMLFRPREPVTLLGLRLQGLIPRRRGEIAASVGEVFSRELRVPEKLKSLLGDPALLEPIRDQVAARVGEFLKEKLDGLPTLVRSVMPAGLESGVRDSIVEEIMKVAPEVLNQMADRIESHLDVRTVVVERIEALDLEHLEQIVLTIAHRELRAIEVLGGVIGFFIGTIQAVLSYFFWM